MVLEDLWKTEEGTITLLVCGLFAFVVINILMYQVHKGEKEKKEYELDKACGLLDRTLESQTIVKAKILSKYTSACPSLQTLMLNSIVFETETGTRLVFAIKDEAQYNRMIEGDCGSLTYRGKRFIAFEREEK